MLHSGIDLHKNDLVIDTLDASGTAVAHRRLRAVRPLVARYFRSLPGPHRAVVESTASWYWLADLLEEEGVELTLAHSKLVKAIAYAKVKTDAVDAHTLAQLLRVDLVPRAHMISPELRGVRDVLRVRLRLVQKRSRCLNAIASLRAKYNVRSVDELPPLVQLEAECHEQQIALLTQQIKRVVRTISPDLLTIDPVQHLLWIPGVGRINAFSIYLEIDDITRFPSAKHFLSYARLVPGSSNSGGKTKHKRTKDGNRYLKIAFTHAAVRAIQYFPEIKTFYQRQCRRKPKPIARGIVAKELGKIVYYVLSKGEAYDGTFKGKPLSRTKQAEWPRRRSPDA
jgi:transposase